MPDEHKKQNYEKVGFMGQVPVLTLGDVEIGDYIVASGFNDGYAKAISPKDITLKDLKQVIGKAWSSSNRHKISLINVSVGLKTNEWVEIMKQQENRLDNLELKIQKLEKIVNKMSTL
jgi:translation elongation factor EF-1beta